MAQTVVWETKIHEDEMKSLQKSIQNCQEEITIATQEKALAETKLMELDQLVVQLLSVNESLVAQLTGRSIKPKSPIAGNIIKKKKVTKKVSAPKVASATTKAMEAQRVTKYSERQPSHLIPVKQNDIEQLKSLHKMYAKIAKTIKNSPTRIKRSKSSPIHTYSYGSSHSNNNSDSESTSVYSKNSRSSKSSKTRIAKKKAEIIEKYSDDARRKLYSSSGSVNIHLPAPAVSFDLDRFDSGNDSDVNSHKSLLNDNGSHHSLHSFNTDNSPSRTSSKKHQNHDSPSRQDLQKVISSLEEEFDTLNNQYRHLLSSVQHSNNSNDLDNDNVEAQAEEIVSVIQKLHKKGEQLRALKSPQK